MPDDPHDTWPAGVDAMLGLGTNIGINIGDKVAHIHDAISRLQRDGSADVVKVSPLYKSAPWGVLDQDWFVNACVSVQTKLSPRALLTLCQSVENDMGRVRLRRWGPRLIDVDILMMRDVSVDETDLKIPHPLIAERGFVLVPLRDLAPRLMIAGEPIAAVIARHDICDVQRLDAGA